MVQWPSRKCRNRAGRQVEHCTLCLTGIYEAQSLQLARSHCVLDGFLETGSRKHTMDVEHAHLYPPLSLDLLLSPMTSMQCPQQSRSHRWGSMGCLSESALILGRVNRVPISCVNMSRRLLSAFWALPCKMRGLYRQTWVWHISKPDLAILQYTSIILHTTNTAFAYGLF